MSKISTDLCAHQVMSPPLSAGGVARRGQPPTVAGLGLSHSHISAPTVSYICGASMVKVKMPMPGTIQRGIRGRVRGFSSASQRRLRDTCHSVRRDALPAFVTLTYPGEFPTDAKVWKRHLDNFSRALGRIGKGRIGAIWKLEPQDRGAPHFHLLVWGIRNLKRFRQWVALVWYRVVGSGDVRHLRAGTQAAQVRSHRGVISYCSKYMGKIINGDGWVNPGRFWGVLHRDAIPWGDVLTAQVPRWFAHRLKRWLRRRTGYTYVSHRGQTFYLERPEEWCAKLEAQLHLSD